MTNQTRKKTDFTGTRKRLLDIVTQFFLLQNVIKNIIKHDRVV